MPRTARSRSADGRDDRGVVAAEFQQRPAEALGDPRTDLPAHPHRPGRADSSATRGSSTRRSPTSRPPRTSRLTARGAPTSAAARSISAWQASAVSGVSSEGFHTTVSPHTSATAVFHAQTATGKLNAVITPTTPSGCQVSISRCPGRSEAMVRPYSWRDSPTANSQMSIISCTSPSASEVILPASTVTSVARSALCSTSSSPSRATSAPRTGAGVVRHVENACAASAIAARPVRGWSRRR